MIVDFARSNVTHPDGYYSSARFAFRDRRAAVWVTTPERTNERVLFATDAELTEPETRRRPYIVTLSDGTEWQIQPKSGGGCSCGKKNTLRDLSIDELLADEVTV